MVLVHEHDETAYAIKLTRDGQVRLCDAAWITPLDDWDDRESPEPQIREICKALTGRDFDVIISEGDILSRRPYFCATCGGTFTIDQYKRVAGMARENRQTNPFGSGSETHEGCPD